MKTTSSPCELGTALGALRPYFVRAAGFSLLAALLVLAPSAYMLEVYDRVVNSRNHFTLLMLTVAVLGAYVLMEVLEWARSEIMRTASVALDSQLRERIFHAIFSARLQRGSGSMQPLNDLRLVCDFLFSPALLALMEAPIALLMMVLLFMISPVLGWSAVVFALAQVTVAWCNERRTKPPLMAANRTSIAAQQYADSSLRNVEVIEAMGMLRNLQRRWQEKQRLFLALQAQASESAGGFQALGKLLQNTLGSLLLGLGCWLLLRDQLNGGGGMMMIASILGGRMLAPLVQAVAQWQTVVNVRDAWSRLQQLLQTVPQRPPGMPLPAPRGRLQVEQLAAGAPGGGQPPILRAIAFALNPGDVLAVIGPSASGKTTLARMLVGLWPAQSGKVRLDDADIHSWNKQELGPHLGYLPQGVELFEGTVAENIARFGTVQPAQVEAAARAVGMHEFILGLPGGYDSPIGDGGARLSGGQRQRLGLARALYGQPVLVVLDEPNSSLDDEGTAALAQAIRNASAQGTTFVVITHLGSALQLANKLLVLRDGRQQAFGPRAEVLAALAQAARPVPAQPAAAGMQATPA